MSCCCGEELHRRSSPGHVSDDDNPVPSDSADSRLFATAKGFIMSTYVLVHGAWHGGWCWERVATDLRERGHDVRTPTLTGLGERSSLAGPDVGLRTHVDDVVDLLLVEDLRDVVLVGHSYAGFVVREVADRLPERIAKVVLVDAWLGRNGDSMESRAPAWFRGWLEANTSDGLIAVPPPASVGVSDPGDVAWLESLLTPQPSRTFSDATVLTGAVDEVECHAIVCSPGNGIPFAAWARDVGCDPVEVASGHDVMIAAPKELSRLLALHSGEART
jgi:pimeloyl-ACP methyl ester carboxylesterase